LLGEEATRFPDWETPEEETSMVNEFCARESAEWAAADLVVCGSEFVREGVVASGGPKDRCVVVPYGLERKANVATKPKRQPGPLRVLTVGAICLRKGSPYVLEVARQMGGRAEFRMVGAIQILPEAQKQVHEHIQLTGIIPRSEMAAQYEWADVFLLPSLCEGSATVTYEAMFQGLPVICTPQTGSTIRDGLDGFIVSPRNADAIVEKLERFAAKSELLAFMSESARQHSAGYTLKKYGERLIAAFRERQLIP
jgi:glycosyltransferase involved in cell wall biosynthesis